MVEDPYVSYNVKLKKGIPFRLLLITQNMKFIRSKFLTLYTQLHVLLKVIKTIIKIKNFFKMFSTIRHKI